ncbi:MAG TPA: hypothetical protein VK673_21940 [Chthoniobacterales bacterium]|nr:hypothetical protein [Chthoniobacterales bacterium]
MKDYLPDAKFNPNDEPIGDKRWWFHEIYRRSGMVWLGPEPDEYSPHTRTEELAIESALRTGELWPRNDAEHRYVEFMGAFKRQAPEKWVVCRRCGVEWKAKGFPAGRMVDIATIPGQQGGWLFPQICICCDDLMQAEARPQPKPKEEKEKVVRHPFKDA